MFDDWRRIGGNRTRLIRRTSLGTTPGSSLCSNQIDIKRSDDRPRRSESSAWRWSGTRLQWHVMPDGDVIVRAKTLSILDSAGSVKTATHMEVEDMNPWGSRLRR
jgi:hypothetical protein